MAELTRAQVTDVDDPLGQGRVRVSLPGRGRARSAVWAEVCVPIGDAPWRPPVVGEIVLVGHEGSGGGSPVVLGRLGPPVEAPDEPPTELRLTHAGHSIVIDDDGITLRVSGGTAELRLTQAGAVLRSGAALRLESGAMTTLSSSGTCRVTGALVQIN